MDMISVIVPVYNVEKYIDQCIESLVKQTYKNKQIRKLISILLKQ